MASYILTVIGYPTSDGHPASLAVERLTYHALLAGLQALLAEGNVGSLMIAAEMAFIALVRQSNHVGDPDLQRLRQYAVQLLNGVRGELTLHEQLAVRPLMSPSQGHPRAQLSPSHRA